MAFHDKIPHANENIVNDCNKIVQKHKTALAVLDQFKVLGDELLAKYSVAELRSAMGDARFETLATLYQAVPTHIATLTPAEEGE